MEEQRQDEEIAITSSKVYVGIVQCIMCIVYIS